MKTLAFSGRLPQRDLPPPGSLLDEARADPELAKRSTTALWVGEQAIDEQLQHLLELGTRNRFWKIDALDEPLCNQSRLEWFVMPKRKLACAKPLITESICHRVRRQSRELTHGPDA